MENNPHQIPKTNDYDEQMNPSASTTQVTPEARPGKTPDKNWSSWVKFFRWIHWKVVVSVFVGFGTVITVSLIMWQGAEWIRKSIDENVTAKLNDERVLRQIAAQIKPSLLFDGRESIISDMGAAQFIKDIRVTKRDNGTNGLPTVIAVDCTRHFASAPIMTSLHNSVAIVAKRGRLNSWEFDLIWIVKGVGAEDDAEQLYRLEFIP
jgi:hypothetical protein